MLGGLRKDIEGTVLKVWVWKLLGLLFIVIFALSAALCVVHSAGVVNTISVGSYPMGVAYDSGKGEIFVANAASNTVSVISGAPNLAAPTATPTPGRVDQGQTSVLSSSAVTTGTSPYTYQWFSEAPGASSYSPISGANSSSYSFATSTSTATGT